MSTTIRLARKSPGVNTNEPIVLEKDYTERRDCQSCSPRQASSTNRDKFSEPHAQSEGGAAAALEITLELAALIIADFVELFFELLSDPFAVFDQLL